MQAGMANDRSYIYADGSFGRVLFGTNWSPIEHMHALSPSAGWAVDDSSHIEGFVGLNDVYPVFTTAYVSDRDMRLSYYSPRVYGFQLGATYAFAPGVDLIGSIQHARFRRGSGPTNNGKGTAGLFGVALSF